MTKKEEKASVCIVIGGLPLYFVFCYLVVLDKMSFISTSKYSPRVSTPSCTATTSTSPQAAITPSSLIMSCMKMSLGPF